MSKIRVLTVYMGNCSYSTRMCHSILFLTILSVYVTSIVYSQLSPLDAHASGNVADNTW